MAVSTVMTYLALACASAYSFSLHDLQPLFESDETLLVNPLKNEHHRTAREIDFRQPQKCCGKELLVLSAADRELMDSCKVESERGRRDAALDKKMKGFSCWTECMAKNKSALNNEGYVIDEDFSKHYLPVYKDPSLHELTEKAIHACIPAANNKAKELGPEEVNGKQCNRAIGLTLMCIRHKVESTCPAEEKIESVDCTKLRQFLKEWNKRTGLHTV